MVDIFFSDSDRIAAKAIKLLTWSDWSHCGLIDVDNRTVIDSRFCAKGVTEYSLTDLYINYPKIKRFRLINHGEKALEAMRSQIGKPYDWTALIGNIGRRNWAENDSWFCSELVAWACLQEGRKLVNKDLWRITPQDLWQAITWAE